MFLFLVGRLSSREDAQDALQASFLTAWRALPRLRRADRFARWLFRIARSRAADVRRRRGPAVLSLDGVEDLLRPTGQDPADTERLRALVAELRPASRALLFLTAVDGWTSDDAARALGTSPATVRRRRARILAHLRKAMERRRGDE